MKLTYLHPNRDYVNHMLGQMPIWLAMFEGTAAERISQGYAFGGWKPFGVGKVEVGPLDGIMQYPGDPPQEPLALIKLGTERIYAYAHEFWSIVQPDGSFEVARLD